VNGFSVVAFWAKNGAKVEQSEKTANFAQQQLRNMDEFERIFEEYRGN